jgi:hypothetical protein
MVVASADEMNQLAAVTRDRLEHRHFSLPDTLDVLHRWAEAIPKDTAAKEVEGAVFLSLWLRRGTLGDILRREMGDHPPGTWRSEGALRLLRAPLGIVGHWPAGNVDIQPLLTGVCSVVTGNAALVRVPTALTTAVEALVGPLMNVDPDGTVAENLTLVGFPHERRDLHEAMARCVDGAVIWGGEEAVTSNRGLPFPPSARVQTFGPRVSLAVLDRGACSDDATLMRWCVRLARDTWQFEQQACSSPQILFVETTDDERLETVASALAEAFAEENRRHPRKGCPASLTMAVLKARARWLMASDKNGGRFPATPDWTILTHGENTYPDAVGGKTLHVVPIAKLADIETYLDASIQTLGVGIADAAAEDELATLALQHGVDRVVPIGSMHTFDSPWDGQLLLAPLTRTVTYISSSSRDRRDTKNV